MKKALKAWWSEKKTYPNGASYTRGTNILYGTGTILVLVALVVGGGAFLYWDINTLVEQWHWASTHSLDDIEQRNLDFVESYGVWIMLGMAAIVLVPMLIRSLKQSRINKWANRNLPD